MRGGAIAPPPAQLIVRIGQLEDLESPADVWSCLPRVGGIALHRLVEGQMLVCARHLIELAAFQPRREARAVLTMGQIDAFVAEFGLRRDDLMSLHGPPDPLLGAARCQMCEATHAEGNLCHDDACRRPLHPQWPAVYCSNACADHDH